MSEFKEQRELPPALATKLAGLLDSVVPFNRTLGIQVVRLRKGAAELACDFRPDLLGDVSKGILHGGVLCTLIDATGGAAAMTTLDFNKELGVNTVDMRVDFLRPAHGKRFLATGDVIRKGSRIAVVEIKVHNEEHVLVASGTTAFSIHAPADAAGTRQALLTMLSE